MQYKRARVVVAHEKTPWNFCDFSDGHHTPRDFTGHIKASIRVASCECYHCEELKTSQESHDKERFGDYHVIQPKSPDLISDHQYMLMTSHVYAFMLKERTYGMLAIFVALKLLTVH